VRRIELDGLDVVAAHLPSRPIVQAVVVLDAGATADVAGAEGVASLLGDAVLKGAGGRGEHDLAVAFERVGAVPGTGVRMDRAEVAVDAPTGLLEEALALLADVVRRPTLDPTVLEDVRATRIDRLRARHTDATYRADRALPSALFASDSRYHLPGGGDLTSLEALETDAIAGFHAARWARGRHTLVLVGDLDGIDLAHVAAPLTGDVVGAPSAGTTPTPAGHGPRVALVDVPGSVQSVLRLGVPGPAFGTQPDEAALEVAQAAVYGSFSSRLNLRLREDLGYTYGASGGLGRLRDGGWLRVGASVRTEVTADAVRETVEVLRTAVADGLTEDEVDQARENLVRRYPVRYDGTGPVAGALVQRITHGLDDDERDVRLAELRDVDAASASAALVAALDVENLVAIVAGDAGAVRGELEALDLGEVRDAA
jgi:predicted Zn-dependent peptidase